MDDSRTVLSVPVSSFLEVSTTVISPIAIAALSSSILTSAIILPLASNPSILTFPNLLIRISISLTLTGFRDTSLRLAKGFTIVNSRLPILDLFTIPELD